MVILLEEKENGSFRFRCWKWSLGKLASYLTLNLSFETSPYHFFLPFLLSSEGPQGPSSFSMFMEFVCPNTALVYIRITSHQAREHRKGLNTYFLQIRLLLLEERSFLAGHILLLPLPIPVFVGCPSLIPVGTPGRFYVLLHSSTHITSGIMWLFVSNI